ncbi:MAG: hypothetical protein CSA62_01805 [Planctomycetota bacterium]|nr:MAG: hypothetical protein CSA62_01805 [Planctomycetota bacterium]
MKRTLIEIAGVGSVLLVMSLLHSEVRSLQRHEDSKTTEINELRSILKDRRQVSTAGLLESNRKQRRCIGKLQNELTIVKSELEVLQGQLRDRTSTVERKAIEAMGQSKLLSRAVESNERTMRAREEQLRRLSQDLHEQIQEQKLVIKGLRHELARDSHGMSSQMLTPTVQLSGEETVGSGTLIASRLNQKRDGYETYVLTAYHVVRNILSDQPELRRKGIACTIYSKEGKIQRRCDMIAKRVSCDLALLKLRGRDRVNQVATLIAPEKLQQIEIWTPVFAVGCPLGNDPIPTGGFVASLANEVSGTDYWMINAPTYFGNSGGGVYNGESRELIAVFSKIYTHGRIRPVVIPHMGLAVPMSLVYQFLREEGHGYLIPGDDKRCAIASPKR